MKYTIKAPPSKTEQLITVDIPTPAAKAVVTDNPLLISVSVADPVATHTITGTTPIDPVVTPPVDPPVVTPDKILGFGANVTGGTKVIEVSDFNSSMIRSGNHIRFTRDVDIDGTFHISGVQNFTLDANGYNVTFRNGKGDGLSVRGASKNILIKGIRVIDASNDCINVIEKSSNVAIVNCTAYGGGDGSIDIADASNVTLQHNLIGYSRGEGLVLITALNVSLYGNIMISTQGKAERMFFAHANYTPGVGKPNVDSRNNIVWNHGRYGSGVDYNATANIVGNYFYSASATNSERGIDTNADPSNSNGNGKIYARGNVSGRGTNLNDNGNLSTEISIPDYAKIPDEDARTAARRILPLVGTAKKTADETKWLQSITIN